MKTQEKSKVLQFTDHPKAPEMNPEEILNELERVECLNEVLELIDLEKRKDASAYSNEYKLAIASYVKKFDFTQRSVDSFDQFLLQLVLSASSIKDETLLFYQNLNRIVLGLINGIYANEEIPMRLQCAMYHLQVLAGEAALQIYKINENDFYVTKARQHFVMAVNFVQEISAVKASEAQCRVSDADVYLLIEDNSVQVIEQAIVDTHNAVEFCKFVKSEQTHLMMTRYGELCELLSEHRISEREYWVEYAQEIKKEAQSWLSKKVS